jgi:hypothetical protein
MRICYYKYPSKNLGHLASLARCMGISVELFEVQNSATFVAAIEDAMLPTGAALVLDVASLKKICHQDAVVRAAALISRRDVSVLLFTDEVDEAADQFLQVLTRGAVLKSNDAGNVARIHFSKDSKRLARELLSQSYPRKPSKAIGLSLRPGTKAEPIMNLGRSSSFMRVTTGKANVFVWSSLRIFDVSQPLAAELEFELAADEYVPAMIFLRFAFGDQCWHNPTIGAGIVIDDPLLNKNYGFINFQQLLRSARAYGYHVTLAFIPWNHWRSRRKSVKMFREYADCFSICAHGCDHTRNEYGSADYHALLRKNFVARKRMQHHARRTALRSEPLMVCPQEEYSLQAMRAFADSRQFIGLMSTACMPRNLTLPQLSGADLLSPAQDSFFGFPVFKRHYWNSMSVFAMSLFLGKPAILVEHHEFFRKGTAGAEEFVRRLGELRPDLKWRSLAQTVTRTHARRRVSESRWEIRFFTDTFQLEHEREQPVKYTLFRRIPETTCVERVRVEGKEVPFSREDGFLRFETQADCPRTLSIQLVVAPKKPTKTYAFGGKYQASVALRRLLSEFRDNVVARRGFAWGSAKWLANKLKVFSG